MTKKPGGQRCRWCGRGFAPNRGRGRPRRFCRPGCRQQAYLARRLAAAHELGPGDVVVRRDELEKLQDAVYGLQAALEDIDNDMADDRGPDALGAALRHLRGAAEPVAGVWLTPVTEDAGS